MPGYGRIFGNRASAGILRNWFGDESDGSLVITEDTVWEVEEDSGILIKQFKDFTINAGVTLTVSHRCQGLIIAVTGKCTINGIIDMSKKMPLRDDDVETEARLTGPASHWLQKIAMFTGGPGGRGNRGGDPGDGEWCGGGYGSAGGGVTKAQLDDPVYYNGGATKPRPPKGITWPYPAPTKAASGSYGTGATSSNGTLEGGLGPGGGGSSAYYTNTQSVRYYGLPGDAYGGGLLALIVKGTLTIGDTGKLISNGGDGGGISDGSRNQHGGGGGGGGLIVLLTKNTIANNGSIEVNGGLGKAAGLDGSVGTIVKWRMTNDGETSPWGE